jgi:TPR repeat protein
MTAQGAEIRLLGNNADGIPVVSVIGDFVERDVERFADVTKELDKAVIVFESDGGELSTGIEIGTSIRLRGYETVVDNGTGCFSACAIAWLGGTTRFVGERAEVGFHAVYLKEGKRLLETGVGNAVVGSYASNLGLRTSAVIFMTSAPPEGMNRLTQDLARRVGIAAEFADVKHLLPVAPEQIMIDPAVAFEKGQEAYLAKDFAKAVRWYRLAAEQGHADAQFYLGVSYSGGEGVDQDHAEAVRWHRLAAEQGDAEAQFHLGLSYDFGEGVDQDHAEAVRWYRLAAEQGDAEAQFYLGLSYALGGGVARDYAEALRWYRLAAEQGHADAQFNLGVSYDLGEGVGQDHAEAVRWYRRAAEQGNAYAQFNLGVSYSGGEGVDQDHEEAVHWYRLSAEQGHADAQFNLGVSYADGEGVGQDHEEAVRWYRLAAEQGDAEAQFNLGVSYADGEGVAQDHAEAVRWYRRAAEQGNGKAIEKLRQLGSR